MVTLNMPHNAHKPAPSGGRLWSAAGTSQWLLLALLACFPPSVFAVSVYTVPYYHYATGSDKEGISVISAREQQTAIVISAPGSAEPVSENPTEKVINLPSGALAVEQARVITIQKHSDNTFLLKLYIPDIIDSSLLPQIQDGVAPPPQKLSKPKAPFHEISLILSRDLFNTLFSQYFLAKNSSEHVPTLVFNFLRESLTDKYVAFNDDGIPIEIQQSQASTLRSENYWHLPASFTGSPQDQAATTGRSHTTIYPIAIAGAGNGPPLPAKRPQHLAPSGSPAYTGSPASSENHSDLDFGSGSVSKLPLSTHTLHNQMQTLSLVNQPSVSEAHLQQPAINASFIGFFSYTLLNVGHASAPWVGYTIGKLFEDFNEPLLLSHIQSYVTTTTGRNALQGEPPLLKNLPDLSIDDTEATDAIHQLLPQANSFSQALQEWNRYTRSLAGRVHPRYLDKNLFHNAYDAAHKIISYINRPEHDDFMALIHIYRNKQTEHERMRRFWERWQVLQECMTASNGKVPQTCLYNGNVISTLKIMESFTAQAWTHLPYYVYFRFLSGYFQQPPKPAIAGLCNTEPYEEQASSINTRVVISNLLARMHHAGVRSLPKWLKSYSSLHKLPLGDHMIPLPPQLRWQLAPEAHVDADKKSVLYYATLNTLHNALGKSTEQQPTLQEVKTLVEQTEPIQSALLRLFPMNMPQPEFTECNWSLSHLRAHWQSPPAPKAPKGQPPTNLYQAPSDMLVRSKKRSALSTKQPETQVVETMHQVAEHYLRHFPLLFIQTGKASKH